MLMIFSGLSCNCCLVEFETYYVISIIIKYVIVYNSSCAIQN